MSVLVDSRALTPVSVLIVDDYALSFKLAEAILSTVGIRSHYLMESRGVVDWVEKNLPDLVLLDITMPSLNGLEVCRRLKANPVTSKVPVIFLTARGAPESLLEGFEAGGSDYLIKPFQSEDLIVRVQAQLMKRKIA